MQARKENIKKDNEIRKERMKNFKKDQTVKHKDEEIKRIKRVNEALKNIVKPTSRNLKKETLPSQNREASAQDLKNFDKAQ
jgi:LPS O-antigen subunit length determinant protein (WzzB/FepE family)